MASDWDKLWENRGKVKIAGDRFSETWLGKVKAEGDMNEGKVIDAKAWIQRMEEQTYTNEETIMITMTDMGELEAILEGK